MSSETKDSKSSTVKTNRDQPLGSGLEPSAIGLDDELLEAFDAEAMYVGMNEVYLFGSEQPPSTVGKDPAEIFVQAVDELHGYLVKQLSVEMLMWADRFIAAEVYEYGKWEASANGTAPAIDRVPKVIIMCDWHYEARETYPSVPMFLEKGFRVWQAGWKKVDGTQALIQCSGNLNHLKMLGHLFTTWSGRKEWTEFPPLVEGLKLLKQSTEPADK